MSQPALHIQTPLGGFNLPLTYQPLTLGRAADNQVQLQDSTVSPYHCVVFRIGDEAHVVDLRSTHGTRINGTPVGFSRLNPGDVMHVGHATVTWAGPPAPPPVPHEPTDIPPAETLRAVAPAAARPDTSPPIKIVPDGTIDTPRLLPGPRLLGELLLPRDMDAFIRNFLRRESGMLILCGPEGSGRTTTAYAMLRHLAGAKRSIATFERPPELPIEGADQRFVHDDREYALAIERVMQRPPQVLMLGEPPHPAAANAALKAAVGKCLVIAVSDAREAVFAISQWLDTGIPPRVVASSLGLVIAHRLVRRLCDQCKEPVKPNEDALKKLGLFAQHVEHIYTPGTCPVCNNTGYLGKLAVFEILEVTDELRGLILAKPSAGDLRRNVDNRHFIPLKLSAYARVAQGLTSIEEADAIVNAG